MKSLYEIQETLATHKEKLSTEYHVGHMAIFGSYARQEQTPESDVDILVDFTEPVGIEFIDLADYLEHLLGQPVDLVSRHGIKPKYFQAIQHDLIDV